MSGSICDACGKTYSNIYNLNKHKENICNNKEKSFPCDICDKTYTTEYKRNSHLTTSKCKDIKIKIDELKEQYENVIDENKKELDGYKKELEVSQVKLNDLQLRNKELEDKLFKLASKPTTVNNTDNSVKNNIRIEKLQPFILHKSDMMEKIDKEYNKEYFVKGPEGVADFSDNFLIRDENGKLCYVCVDPSRDTFVYKKKDGTVVRDIHAKQFTKKLLDGIIPQAIKIYEKSIEESPDKTFSYGTTLSQIKKLKSNNLPFTKELAYLTTNDDDLMFESDEEELLEAIECEREELEYFLNKCEKEYNYLSEPEEGESEDKPVLRKEIRMQVRNYNDTLKQKFDQIKNFNYKEQFEMVARMGERDKDSFMYKSGLVRIETMKELQDKYRNGTLDLSTL